MMQPVVQPFANRLYRVNGVWVYTIEYYHFRDLYTLKVISLIANL